MDLIIESFDLLICWGLTTWLDEVMRSLSFRLNYISVNRGFYTHTGLTGQKHWPSALPCPQVIFFIFLLQLCIYVSYCISGSQTSDAYIYYPQSTKYLRIFLVSDNFWNLATQTVKIKSSIVIVLQVTFWLSTQSFFFKIRLLIMFRL